MVNIFFLICQDQGLGVMGAASQSKRTGWCCWQGGRGSAWPVRWRLHDVCTGTCQVRCMTL